MPEEKPTEKNNGVHITADDLFGSIPKPIDYDPFEGIDMEAISVCTERSKVDAEDEEIDEINRFEGFDIGDLSGALKRDAEGWDADDFVSFDGIDTEYIGIRARSKPPTGQPSDSPEPGLLAKSVEGPLVERPLTEEISTGAPTLIGRSKIDHVRARINRIGKK